MRNPEILCKFALSYTIDFHMAQLYINRNRTELWKKDALDSVDFYNDWFLHFAPKAFCEARGGLIEKVRQVMCGTGYLANITVEAVKQNPSIVSILRMCTAPPVALDRLAGLSRVSRSLIKGLEKGKLPMRMTDAELTSCIGRIVMIISRMLDVEMLTWVHSGGKPAKIEEMRSASVIADRLCGTLADPVIRNEQEKRQLHVISEFLERRGYSFVEARQIEGIALMPEYTYTYHWNVPASLPAGDSVNIPVDVAVMRKRQTPKDYPLLIECKSAGDFANTNKRRKEEAMKMTQLKATYGEDISFILFLCGYFDTTYLGYEASEGIDWIWEHRIEDFAKTGI